MLKFLAGVLAGALLAVLYVRFDVALPDVLQLGERLRGNLVSTSTETELFDLGASPATRARALEVYFDNRARDAARIDAEAGHPFLEALMTASARHKARQLLGQWQAFDEVLGKPALREALEQKHGTPDAAALKQAMLTEALAKDAFMISWLQRKGLAASGESLLGSLRATAIANKPAATRVSP